VTSSADFPPIDFESFHSDTLPSWLRQGRGRLAASGASHLSALAFRLVEGPAFTYRPCPGGVEIAAGDDAAATVIEIALDAWQGLVHELEAAAGLVYAGRIRCVRGAAVDLMAWESTLRTLYNGRPPYDPARVELRDRDGRLLDPAATFTADADRDDLVHFLRTAGYLFVRDVFHPEEVAGFLAEAEELRREARQGDKLSWWGKTVAGEEVLCRVTRGTAKPRLATLPAAPRVLALAALADEPVVYKKGEGKGVTVIFKRPDVHQGLGDLPWHRDCGMGGHAVMCPTLLISVYLRDATPETGELVMLPGSHRCAFNAHDATDPTPYAAHFAARPGDVSLHYGDTVHAAPRPTAPDREHYRISAVVSFAPARAHHHLGHASYNDVLHQREDGQIEHLEAVAKRL